MDRLLEHKVAVIHGAGGRVFAASDLARTITGTEINISCGALVD